MEEKREKRGNSGNGAFLARRRRRISSQPICPQSYFFHSSPHSKPKPQLCKEFPLPLYTTAIDRVG